MCVAVERTEGFCNVWRVYYRFGEGTSGGSDWRKLLPLGKASTVKSFVLMCVGAGVVSFFFGVQWVHRTRRWRGKRRVRFPVLWGGGFRRVCRG